MREGEKDLSGLPNDFQQAATQTQRRERVTLDIDTDLLAWMKAEFPARWQGIRPVSAKPLSGQTAARLSGVARDQVGLTRTGSRSRLPGSDHFSIGVIGERFRPWMSGFQPRFPL